MCGCWLEVIKQQLEVGRVLGDERGCEAVGHQHHDLVDQGLVLMGGWSEICMR